MENIIIIMTDSERFKITSNEYADLLIDYSLGVDLLSTFSGVSYNYINDQYAVAYLPVSNMTYNAVYKYSYTSIPKCYGILVSLDAEQNNSYYASSISNYDYTGRGVLVGFVDGGIDYRNPVFSYPDNTTKIVSIWDQSIESVNNYPDGFYYGTEYSREQINMALNSSDPLSIVPSIEESGQGTAMAGVAAGNYIDQTMSYIGTAPNAEIVIAKLKRAKPYLKEFFGLSEEDLCYQENDIMFGIQYLLEVAQKLQRPIVICLGLGSWQGSHKGQDIISRYISEVGELSGVAVVIGSGEEGNRGTHYYGEINSPDNYNLVELNVGMNQEDFTMELWGYAPNILTVDISAPNGDFVSRISYNLIQQNTIPIAYNNTIIYVDNRTQEPFAGDQLILFRFKKTEEGIWSFRISGTDLSSRYHIWLPMHQFISSNTNFINANTYTTISEPGNTVNLITVTTYDPVSLEIYYYASRGFTKVNVPKPDITAPGVNILAPTSNNLLLPFTGSSISAAYTTGIVARLFEWGIIDGNLPKMNCTFIRYILTSSAQRDSSIIYPNPDWGFGILNDNVVEEIKTGRDYF